MNRAKIYEICKNPWFERTVVTLLFINMLVLALMTFPSIKNSSWFEWLTVLDNVILALFVLELLLRLFAERLVYFKDGWNIFDFAVILISVVGTLGGGTGLSALRVFRALRILRVISVNPSYRRIINAFFACLNGIAAVFSIALLVNVVFAIIGCELLSETDPAQFGSFFPAMYALFKLALLFTWYDVAEAAGASSSGWITFYFMSYFIINSFILFNMMLGIVFEAYDLYKEEISTEKNQLDELNKEFAEKLDELAMKISLIEQINSDYDETGEILCGKE